MDINGNNPVESVVDPGSSIVAMSEEVCLKLALTYDPSICIPFESANGGIDEGTQCALWHRFDYPLYPDSHYLQSCI